jgi:putative ABC transport system permease protein
MKPLRHALRRLGRAPGFTAIALITLALGIGANTAIFSVVNAVLLKPLPYPDADRLVGVWHVAPGVQGLTGDVNCSPTMYYTYREQSRAFQSIGLWSQGGVSVTGIGDPERLTAVFMTFGTLDTLGVQPVAGRWFSQSDDTPGTPATVILSYGYWQRRFGGNASAIGGSLTVDGRQRTIIGVMPAGFRFLDLKPDLLFPQRLDRNKLFLGQFSYSGIARLKPGITIQQANADIARILPMWLDAWPTPPGFSRELFKGARIAPRIKPSKEEVVGDVGATLWVLAGTIGLVLLIACANVANLLLVRAESRQQELAIRTALGADWVQIARELLSESMALGVVGGVLGLGLAFGALRLLVAKGPATLPRLSEIGIDPAVLVFNLGVSLLAGLFFGLIPVIKYAGPRVAMALRSGSRSMSHSRERHRARNVLVVVQVALALVLLIGSGLMIRTFQALREVRPGFTQPERVQLMRISIPGAAVREDDRVMRVENDMLDKLAAIPGVSSVAFASSAPLENNNSNDPIYADDHQYVAGQIPPLRRFRFVTPRYFESIGQTLVAGRDYTWTDLYQKRPTTIISDNLARELWGEPVKAIGKRIRVTPNDPWYEIIGVAADVRDDGAQKPAPAFVYWPAMMEQFWGSKPNVIRGGVFLVRTSRAATESLLTESRSAIWSVIANLPVYQVRTLEDLNAQSMARTSFTLVLLAVAGAMALVLGVVGIYGVIAYAVSQRTREIGIRIALGAPAGGLQRMFVGQGLVLAAIGAAVGLTAAAGLTRLMKTLLFGVEALDPATYAIVSAVLIAAAALASYVPARRATRVHPTEALRAE